MGVLAVSDNDSTVLYKKETNSDAWKHYNNINCNPNSIISNPDSTSTRSTHLQPVGIKTSLKTSSTGTPPSIESLNVEDTTSVAPGGSEPTEADSGSALKDHEKVQKVCLLKARQVELLKVTVK
ncbi:hypothetical protein MACJ_002548 [Theileria orientalis]|nr:hypothetical protein MACJ_002548 [Theileria orientalis]